MQRGENAGAGRIKTKGFVELSALRKYRAKNGLYSNENKQKIICISTKYGEDSEYYGYMLDIRSQRTEKLVRISIESLKKMRYTNIGFVEQITLRKTRELILCGAC